jgi:hypothetical protein
MFAVLVIVLIIDQLSIAPYKSERKAPIPIHPHRPMFLKVMLQWMKFEARQIHVVRTGSGVETAENIPQLFGVCWLNSSY